MGQVLVRRWFLALALFWGCADRASAPDAATSEVDASVVPAWQLRVDVCVMDGGCAALGGFDAGVPVVDPAEVLRVTSNLRLRNHRVWLFDDSDRALASDDLAADVADGGWTYEIRLAEPLRSGHRYTLLIDAQSGDSILDLTGTAHPDVRLGFQVSGEKSAPAVKKATKRMRR